MTARADSGWFSAAGSPAGRARFGTVYAAANGANGVGLVLVPPFGADAIAADRGLVAIAEAAAAAGIVAIRFDLDGTGDSAGDDREPGRVEAWLASIADACDLARSHGADRVVLVGVRTGATLAVLAAGRRADVAGLVAIAAVPSGRTLVRELREAHGAPADTADIDELAGYALTAETRVSLAQIDLGRLGQRPAPAVLVIDGDGDGDGNAAWVARLTSLGAEVAHRRIAGAAELAPAVVAAILEHAAARPALPSVARPAPRTIDRETRVELRATGTAPYAVTEELIGELTAAVTAERTAALTGRSGAIATRDHDAVGTEPRRALVALTDEPRALGPHRQFVDLARALVADDPELVVLRVPNGALAAALAWCRRAGARRIAVLGVVAAADRALDAAASGDSIDMVIAIAPSLATLEHAAARASLALVEPGTLDQVMRGEADLRAVATTMFERARAIAIARGRVIAKRLSLPVRDGLATALLSLAARRVSLRFVFAPGAMGHSVLLARAAATVTQLVSTRAITVDEIAGADAAFTSHASQAALAVAITTAITALRAKR